jgi:hypothetical protein
MMVCKCFGMAGQLFDAEQLGPQWLLSRKLARANSFGRPA